MRLSHLPALLASVAAMGLLLGCLDDGDKVPFTDIGAGLTDVNGCSFAWGDYDSDGDLDLALVGDAEGSGVFVSQVYGNDGGVFTEINAGLAPALCGDLACGDYDGDGDLDLALSGSTGMSAFSKVYRNNGDGTFADIDAGLAGVSYCSIAWGDYDNDGDLDLALAGSLLSKVYRNDNGAFTDIAARLTGVMVCSLAWGDYDNDGDLDLALAGSASGERVSKVYRNDGGTFTDIDAGLAGVGYCALAWGDYDNDGDLDLALAGTTTGTLPFDRISKIYENDGGAFTDIGAGLIGVCYPALAWGDYDSDGDLDLVVAGQSSSGALTKVYRNDAGAFADAGEGLTDVDYCSVVWGDYDGDGDLDLALAGTTSKMTVPRISKVYRNDLGKSNTALGMPTDLSAVADVKALTGSLEFTNASQTVTAAFSALTGTQITFGAGSNTVTGTDSTFMSDGLTPGDLVRLDSDGDVWYEVASVDTETQLTLVEEYQGSGAPGTGSVIKAADRTFLGSQVVAGGFVRLDADGAWVEVATVESDTQLTLAAPYAAAGGSGASSVKTVRFSWGAPAVADETPDAGLSYNLRVGTTSGGNEIASGMADATGLRRLPARGAIQPGTSTSEWTLTLPAGDYFWSVQAVDTGFMGGEWAAEETVTVP